MTRNVRHCEPFFEKRRGNPLKFFWGVGFVGTLGKFVILSAAKNPQNLRYALNLWIATLALLARNDGVGFLGVLAGLGGILFLGWLGNFCFLGLAWGFGFVGVLSGIFLGLNLGKFVILSLLQKGEKSILSY